MKSTKPTTKSNVAHEPRRCQHRTPSGRRCRLAVVDSTSGLCFQHSVQRVEALHPSNLRSTLAGDVTQFEEAQQVNQFLSKLLILLAEDRISSRRAAVMAYTCNLILRTLTVNMQEHRIFNQSEEPMRLNVDLSPYPGHEQNPSVESHPQSEVVPS